MFLCLLSCNTSFYHSGMKNIETIVTTTQDGFWVYCVVGAIDSMGEPHKLLLLGATLVQLEHPELSYEKYGSALEAILKAKRWQPKNNQVFKYAINKTLFTLIIKNSPYDAYNKYFTSENVSNKDYSIPELQAAVAYLVESGAVVNLSSVEFFHTNNPPNAKGFKKIKNKRKKDSASPVVPLRRSSVF